MISANKLVLKKLWLAIGFAYLVFIIVVTLIPEPDVTLGFEGFFKLLSDKAVHFLAYGLLMGWFIQIFQTRKSHIFMALAFTLMGVLLEYLQGMSQARMFEVADMVANGVGVLLAWALAYTRLANLLAWFERSVLNFR